MSVLNDLIVSVVQVMPKSVVGFFSRKYIAGESLQDAINVTKELNSQNAMGTIDVLGEAVQNKEEAILCKKQALEVLEAIKSNNLDANLSIKPTQMGLEIDYDFGFNQIKEIVCKAKDLKNFVRLDMEDATFTDVTFRLLKDLLKEFDNVGVVVQAYLKRTYDDVVLLNKLNTNYRLCKGIYNESPDIAYKDRQRIRDNYMDVLEVMIKNGNYVGIATHDEYLVEKSYELIKKYNLTPDKYEFQMLLGVRDDLRKKIISNGHRLRVYIPFGKEWYKYSIRRLKENPQMAGHIFKALFRF